MTNFDPTTAVIEPDKVFVTYGRKVSDDNYGSEELNIMVQVDVPVGANLDMKIHAATEAAQEVKATVLDQLGLNFHADPIGGGRVIEAGREPVRGQLPTQAPNMTAQQYEQQAVQNVQAAFPGAEVAPQPAPYAQAPQAAPQTAPVAAGGPPPANPNVKVWYQPCGTCGGQMWDNRPKKAGYGFGGDWKDTSPDAKCKNKNCDGVVWPPRGN
jgi:hypothetical protein